MAIKLNQNAIEHAKQLIRAGEVEVGKKWNWQEHQATQDEIVRFLNTHNLREYAQWFLAIDTDKPENNKDRYLLPVGDFRIVHREGLEAAAQEAEKRGLGEVSKAIKSLLTDIDSQVQ